MTKVMITGAAGNLGSLLSRHIKDNEKDLNLILMQHLKEIPKNISEHPRKRFWGRKILESCLDL